MNFVLSLNDTASYAYTIFDNIETHLQLYHCCQLLGLLWCIITYNSMLHTHPHPARTFVDTIMTRCMYMYKTLLGGNGKDVDIYLTLKIYSMKLPRIMNPTRKIVPIHLHPLGSSCKTSAVMNLWYPVTSGTMEALCGTTFTQPWPTFTRFKNETKQ